MPTAVNTATYAAVPIGTVPTTLTINGETRTRAINAAWASYRARFAPPRRGGEPAGGGAGF